MQCFVYKSLRKADTYVFLRAQDAFELMPDALRTQFVELVFVIEI